MKKKIFISYKRLDSIGAAGWICEKLKTLFGQSSVFFDIGKFHEGNINEIITKAIDQSCILILVIGPGWSAKEAAGRQKNPGENWVLFEVSEALKKGIRIIPVLLENINMPEADKMPGDLEKIRIISAINMRLISLDADFRVLAKEIKRERRRSSRRFLYQFMRKYLGLALLTISVISVFLYNNIAARKASATQKREMILENITGWKGKIQSQYSYFSFVPSVGLLEDTAANAHPEIWSYNQRSKKTRDKFLGLSDSIKQRFRNIKYFFISQYNVNNLEWEAVMAEKPPKVITRNNMLAFIENLNIKTGHRFRLPTPLETEYITVLDIINPALSFRNKKDSKQGIKSYDDDILLKDNEISDLGFRLCSDTKIISPYLDRQKKLHGYEEDITYLPEK